MNDPLISVILPTYNRARLLSRAVQSVLDQDCRAFELLIFDDGSTDNTSEVLEKWARKDNRIRAFHYEHSGIAQIRNKAIGHVRGRYVAFLDDDDIYCENRFSAQVEFMESHPECGMVYSRVRVMEETTGREMRIDPAEKHVCFEDMIRGFPVAVNAVLVRRECFERLGSFRQDLEMGEDTEMWMRIALHYRVHAMDDVVAVYYRHTQNMTENWVKLQENLIRVYKQFRDGAGTTREQKRQLSARGALMSYRLALRAYRHESFSKAAVYFCDAIRVRPDVGNLLVPGRKGVANVYPLLKPYLALAASLLRYRPKHIRRRKGN